MIIEWIIPGLVVAIGMVFIFFLVDFLIYVLNKKYGDGEWRKY